MNKQLFKVISAGLRAFHIRVTIANINNDELTFFINKNHFKTFLENYGRLEIPAQIIGEEGACELHFSAMTIEEYYQYGDISHDLYDYIIINKLSKSFDQKANSLAEILK